MLAAVGVVVATTGGDDGDSAAKKPPAADPSLAEAADDPLGEGKTYTKVPEGCELVKAATVARLAPGAECEPSQFDNATMPAMITRMPRWKWPSGAADGPQNLNVHLTVGPHAAGMFDMQKKSAEEALKDVRDVTDSRPLDGLGEKAHVVHGVDREPFDLAGAKVIVSDGNATFTVELGYHPQRSGLSERQAVDGVVAAARDVLAALA
ncbi:hypothetical protein H3146_18990 [Streptomyces sp. OF3]|uniref:DUF3558 domain-containing protein n=1 Tax=Streptomyces alkaliterrae TaxID=2213162 RepID=A0A5P0YZC3_9ACTN|nr:hypothetical protein [Streptomyces alkaliterrae]MBB1261561.1 hypothetical protein [Streptomyces alkaliterrae]MQS03849.1 hypothetical protein [Streptomyces alkaliterrae]